MVAHELPWVLWRYPSIDHKTDNLLICFIIFFGIRNNPTVHVKLTFHCNWNGRYGPGEHMISLNRRRSCEQLLTHIFFLVLLLPHVNGNSNYPMHVAKAIDSIHHHSVADDFALLPSHNAQTQSFEMVKNCFMSILPYLFPIATSKSLKSRSFNSLVRTHV